MSFKTARLLCAAAALLAAAPARAAEKTVAVLSSAGGAYMEAFSAFQAGYGSGVRYFDISKEKPALPPGTITVVAFGAKAAAQTYPPGVDLVYAMAPGFFLKPDARAGRTVKVSMRSSPEKLFSKLLEVQPGLKKLRIFWTSPGYASIAQEYSPAGAKLGLEISVARVESADSLPVQLRELIGKADAFWLPPDPLLISPDSLMILKQFSWENGIPMYATTKGLAREGACAAVGVSFAQAGAAAASAAKALRKGEDVPSLVYPDEVQLTLNASAARRCGITYSQELLREADLLYP